MSAEFDFQDALASAIQKQLDKLGAQILVDFEKASFKMVSQGDFPLLTTPEIQKYLGKTFVVKSHQGDNGMGWFITVDRMRV